MATTAVKTIKIGPIVRLEGHLDIELTVDTVGGETQVIDAKSAGTMFRGFEAILRGRDPRDATHYTQRICGVCPTSHAMASSLALEAAFRVTPPENGRILRNLMLGANFLQSHILHFYHLAALDYVNTSGILDLAPWTPRMVTSDMVDGQLASDLVGNYVEALAVRRKAHQMAAIFGGKMPISPSFAPGGCTQPVSAAAVTQFRGLLNDVKGFISNKLVLDTLTLGAAFPQYAKVGQGCGNLLAYGVFDLDAAGSTKLLSRGRITGGTFQSVSAGDIREYVKYSYYSSGSGANPSGGSTTPSVGKSTAYSWVKAPRYEGVVHEVGPLARMRISGLYIGGTSVLNRLVARALEAELIAQALHDELVAFSPEDARGAVRREVGIRAQEGGPLRARRKRARG